MTKFSALYLSSFSFLISVFSFFNIIYSNYFDIFFNIENYIYTLFISLTIGGSLLFFNRKNSKKITIYEKIFTVLLGYFLFPLIISVPYYLGIQNVTILNSKVIRYRSYKWKQNIT